MTDEIEQRKERVKHYLKNNKQLLVYAVLLIIILISFYARISNFENLKDVTTGKYITLELDSEIFSRYAQYIAEHGKLFTVDPMRFYPVGADLSSIGTGVSYFVAYLYQFLHVFDPSITVQYVDLLYPAIAMAIMSIFLFLLVRRIFNWKVGLLAVTIIQFIPSFLFRSVSSDHDILVMALFMMSLYFFIVAWQSEKMKNKIIFAVISAVITSLSRFTGGSGGLILTIIGLFIMILIILDALKKEDYYSYTIWLAITTILNMMIFGMANTLGSILSLMGIIPYACIVIGAVVFFVLRNEKLHSINKKLEMMKLPDGIKSIIITAILGTVLLFIFYGTQFFIDRWNDLVRVLFHTYAETRWTLTVAENKRPYVIEWFSQIGRIVVVSMIAGSILLFYNTVKKFDRKKHLTIAYAIFIFVYIFSRYSPSSLFNGESTISKITFYGSVLIFAGYIVYTYLNAYYNDHEMYKEIQNIDTQYIFIFIWFILFIVAATLAVRLLFEFTPIAVILASYALIALFDYFNTRKEPVLRWVGIIFLILLLFSPFSFAYGAVYSDFQGGLSIKYMGPGYNQQWQYAGQWARQNTPETAIFAHWWDYGYWVQSEFKRTTVGDGGNFILWWNYLMGRKVLTGQTQEEALPFLYAHNATNLLIVQDDLGKYTAYSSIGSDENYDRFSWINAFQLNQQASKETRNGSEIYYQGGFPLDEDYIYQGKIFPAQQAGIGAIKVPFENVIVNNTQVSELKQPSIIMVYQNMQIELPLKCIYINNRLYEFENASYDGCFRVVPVITSQTDGNAIGAGYFLSRRTYHSNFGQLYMLDKQSPYFKIAYDDSKSIPLAIYQGRQIGPIKIWSINYPANFSLTKEELEYNLRTSYPDAKLMKPQ